MQHRLVARALDPSPWRVASIVLAAAAWLVIVGFAVSGSGAVVRHDQLILGSLPLWEATVVFIAGWTVMLLAMMLLPALEVIERWLTAADVMRFTSTYLLAWTAFGLAVFFFDVGVHATVNHVSWLAAHPWLVSGTTLIAVGGYQMSRLKSASLEGCREFPAAVAQTGPLHAGMAYARRCIGANAGLMLLAFALGASSLSLMAAITAMMIWEASPSGGVIVKVSGAALLLIGVLVVSGV